MDQYRKWCQQGFRVIKHIVYCRCIPIDRNGISVIIPDGEGAGSAQLRYPNLWPITTRSTASTASTTLVISEDSTIKSEDFAPGAAAGDGEDPPRYDNPRRGRANQQLAFESYEEELSGSWDESFDGRGASNFGVICGNWGGNWRSQGDHERMLAELHKCPGQVLVLQEACKRVCKDLQFEWTPHTHTEITEELQKISRSKGCLLSEGLNIVPRPR